MNLRHVVSILALPAILSCGGGGGASSPAVPGQAGGIWSGLVGPIGGVNLSTYGVSNNGGQLILLASNSDMAAVQLSGSDSNVTATGTAYAPGDDMTAANVSGSILVPQTSLNASTVVGVGGPSAQAESLSLTYDILFNRPVSLASLAGTYAGNAGGTGYSPVGSFSATVTAAGAITGTQGTNTVTGHFSQPDPTVNVFEVSLGFGGTTYTGLAFWSDGGSPAFTAKTLYGFVTGGGLGIDFTMASQNPGSIQVFNETTMDINSVFIWRTNAPPPVRQTNLLTAPLSPGSVGAFYGYYPPSYYVESTLADGSTQTKTAVISYDTATPVIVSSAP